MLATPDDPNFPPNLSIFPSSRSKDQTSDSEGGELDAEQDIENFGIAGRTWEAAYLLRRYLSVPSSPSSPRSPIFDPPNPLPSSSCNRRRIILEVGSGTGFLGLSIAPHLLSTDTLVLTDLDNVCPLLEKNLASAQLKRSDKFDCLIRPLPWGDSTALDKLRKEDLLPDIILASDLVYFPFLYPPLLRTLIHLTDTGNPTLIFSYKIRSLVREQPFWEAFGRWFRFEAVQVGEFESKEEEEQCDSIEGRQSGEGEATLAQVSSPRRIWKRFGASWPSQSTSISGETDELYVFIAHRWPTTLGSRIGDSDEDLMLGTNGCEGELSGGGQFEEMLLSSLEWE